MRRASYPLDVMLMGLMALLVRRDGSTRPDLNSLRAGRTGPDRTTPTRYSDGTRLDSTPGLTRPDPTWPPLLLLGASSTSRPRRHTVAMAISLYVSHRSSAHTPTPTTEIPHGVSYTSKADQSIHTPAHPSTYRSHTTIHPPFSACSGLNSTHNITSLQPPSPSVPKQALPAQASLLLLHAHMLLQLMRPHRPAVAPLVPHSSLSLACDAHRTFSM